MKPMLVVNLVNSSVKTVNNLEMMVNKMVK